MARMQMARVQMAGLLVELEEEEKASSPLLEDLFSLKLEAEVGASSSQSHSLDV